MSGKKEEMKKKEDSWASREWGSYDWKSQEGGRGYPYAERDWRSTYNQKNTWEPKQGTEIDDEPGSATDHKEQQWWPHKEKWVLRWNRK